AEGASDLYLVSGVPASLRVSGEVRHLSEEPLTGDAIEQAILPVLPPHAAEQYKTKGSGDSSLRRSGVGRFRVNLHRERGNAAATIRALPSEPPRLADLNLPSGVAELTTL